MFLIQAKKKSRTRHQPSMLCPPSYLPTIKGEIQTDDCPYPRIPLASFPRIEGSQQCYSTSCGGVLVAAAAIVVTAVTAADDVVTAVAAVVVVADRQWKRLRCHVRWCRSSRRLTRTDCPLSGVAEVTVPLVAGATFDTASAMTPLQQTTRAPRLPP